MSEAGGGSPGDQSDAPGRPQRAQVNQDRDQGAGGEAAEGARQEEADADLAPPPQDTKEGDTAQSAVR